MRVIRSLVAALLWLAAPATAQQGGGLQAQILHAFQTEDCNELLEHDIKSVETLALQAACYEQLAKYRKLQAGLLRSYALSRTAAAAQRRLAALVVH